MSDLLFVVGMIYILVNLTMWLAGKPTTWSWTRAFFEINLFLSAILLAGATPWVLILVFGITNFKLYFGITVTVWFGTISGLVKYMTYTTPTSSTLSR